MLNDNSRAEPAIQDPLLGRLRRVPVDDAFADLVLPDTPTSSARRDVDADRDLRVDGRSTRSAFPSCRRPASASRSRNLSNSRPAEFPLRAPDGTRKFAISGLHRQLRDDPGSHRFLAGWRQGGEKFMRVERIRGSGDVRRTTASTTTSCRVVPVHAQLNKATSSGRRQPHPALRRADPDSPVLGVCRSSGWRRRARACAQPPTPEGRSRPTSTRCVYYEPRAQASDLANTRQAVTQRPMRCTLVDSPERVAAADPRAQHCS